MIYLDNAATAFPKAPGVGRAMARACMAGYGNPGRGGHRAALAADRALFAVREQACAFFGGDDPNTLILTPGCTAALNIAILGLPLAGSHVITTALEHNSILRPLEYLRRQGKIQVTILRPDATQHITPDMVSRAFRPNTRLVAMAHASNVVGTVQPVEEIARRCRARGIWFLLDAAQSAGHIRYRLAGQPFDLVAFPGHKGLMGPMGIGGLYTAPGVPLEAVIRGGTGANSLDLYPPTDLPEALEAGTPNLPGILGLGEALAFVDKNQRMLSQNSMHRARDLAEGIPNIPGFSVLAQPEVPVICVCHRKLTPQQLSQALNDAGICARAGLHCAPLIHEHLGLAQTGTLRLSPGGFTTRAQCQRALSVLWRADKQAPR
nr:aminotransferase class V-fold PLP-dependent enzyme [bacterium]